MKLLGLVLRTKRQYERDLEIAEACALASLVRLALKKDKIFLDAVNLGPGPNLIQDNLFLGSRSCVNVEVLGREQEGGEE